MRITFRNRWTDIQNQSLPHKRIRTKVIARNTFRQQQTHKHDTITKTLQAYKNFKIIVQGKLKPQICLLSKKGNNSRTTED